MASPIPTQLSPGVNVSEIDLSQFVQPIAGNAAGMAGVFNWGPCLVATPVTTESDLAAFFGKPTLDQSDTTTSDFLAASNFLRYSSNLKVVRMEVTGDYNATSLDPGITWINSVDNRIIRNEDAFISLGGFSASAGIESKAYFKARYPGNFGDSLKVIVWDGTTGDDVLASTQYQDYSIYGGYNLSTLVGVTSGSIGYTFDAKAETDTGNLTLLGVTSGTHNFYVVTIIPPSGQTPQEFINTLNASPQEAFKILYATGTTSSNASLSASNPSGNAANYYALENVYAGDFGTSFSPFELQTSVATSVFAKPSLLSSSGAVDIMFLDADSTNMNSSWSIGQRVGNATITGFTNFQQSGVPSNFGDLIYQDSGQNLPSGYPLNTSLFQIYRDQMSNVAGYMHPANAAPATSLRGWARFVGLTGGVTFQYTVNGVRGTIGITFDSVGGLTGVRRDFSFGMKQFGYGTNSTIVTGREDYTTLYLFDKTPNTSQFALDVGGSNDEISFAVIDTQGKFGPKGGVLEKFELLSKATDTKNIDGESTFYKDYINNNSRYVYLTKAFGFTGGGDYSSVATTSFGDILTQYKGVDGVTYNRVGYYESQLGYGESSTTSPSLSEQSLAYSIFADDNSAVDILFIPESSVANDTSSSVATLEKEVYNNVIEPRKDTVLVIPTPQPTSGTQHSSVSASRAVNYRNSLLGLPSNSYTFLVAGRKVFYDAFNNQTKRMSLASDVAGIMSAQEIAWESPAGFARGSLRNSIKLETQFSKQDRDNLYSNQINFFNEFADGSGTILFGDKTLLVKPSAFDRINVRRVFIFLEKSIAAAAKYSLFEFNDEFTRAQFRNLVTPFLNNIVAQRGISDFRIVCDESNNTADVIDRNQFVADIYIKPLKSINFIQLNFIATRSDFSLTTIE